ncbi:CrcB family protein [Arthrobacter sp. S41]|uniref:fluoride efflux transporter FluC n=1 Tax=Micrococcaceae TaxID=1268 RepID=UPI001036C99C|nr:CrcB family protein [Arthrobacter sp. S41]TAP26917.1 CrcB family protein [Arthrobacter sp. S41]
MSTNPGAHIPKFRRVDLALVFVGGTLGTASRLALSLLQPQGLNLPVMVLLVNVVGAFALGWLLTSLSARGPETSARRRIRLLVGTGFMGGFTTYSALATDSMLLTNDGSVLLGLGYGLGTVLVGALATWCGMLVGTKRRTSAKGN